MGVWIGLFQTGNDLLYTSGLGFFGLDSGICSISSFRNHVVLMHRRSLSARRQRQKAKATPMTILRGAKVFDGSVGAIGCWQCVHTHGSSDFTQRNPTWLLPVVTSPLLRVPTMYRVQY